MQIAYYIKNFLLKFFKISEFCVRKRIESKTAIKSSNQWTRKIARLKMHWLYPTKLDAKKKKKNANEAWCDKAI